MVVQFYKYTHSKWMNFTVCEFKFNKDVFKKGAVIDNPFKYLVYTY